MSFLGAKGGAYPLHPDVAGGEALAGLPLEGFEEMAVRAWLVGAVVGALVPAGAFAADPSRTADRASLPARVIERPLQAPRGWTAGEVAVRRWSGVRVWDGSSSGSSLHDARVPAQAVVAIRHGLTDRLQIGGRADLALAHAGRRGLGDIALEAAWSLLHRDAPLRSVAFLGSVSGPPSGSVHEGTEGLVGFTAGSWASSLGLAGRHQLGPTAWTATLMTVHRAPSARVPAWVDPSVPPDRVARPGSEAWLEVDGLLQIGPVAALGGGRIGVVGTTIVSDLDGPAPLASGGLRASTQAGGLLSLTRALDVRAVLVLPLLGPQPTELPLEPLGHLASRSVEISVQGWF